MNREEWETEPVNQAEAIAFLGEALQAEVNPAPTATPTLQVSYQVAMPNPTSHLFEVTLRLQGWSAELGDRIDLKLPVWTPGSYLVREYARHLQEFAAMSAAGDRLPWQKVSKNHWQLEPQSHTDLVITYKIYANELTVRTNHLDGTHGYFNGAGMFLSVAGFEDWPMQVAIAPPYPTWRVTTALPAVPDHPNTYEAADFDTLVDSPFEIGQHQLFEFEAAGKMHQLAIWGHGNLEPEALLVDMQRIIQVEADLFGGLPYDRYLFLLHLASQGFGGLEHKHSCSLIYQRFGFRSKEKYDRFIQLVAHEFFHLWNIKRIRPKALETFDYDQENYTPSLWFSEGTTSYYDLVVPYRAGIYDLRTYLNSLSKEITRFLTTPGRLVQALSESSLDAWIKLYRQDANSPNAQMSYYLKGEMVSLLLDLLIRQRHHNGRSLDDVLRRLWEQFGQSETGFTPTELEQAIAIVAATDLTDFFAHCLHTTDELPFDTYLQPFGLQLRAEQDESLPHLGLTLKSEAGREVVKFVEAQSPAQLVGLDAGDELLALDGIRVTAEQLPDRLRDFRPGDPVKIAFFHLDELCLRIVTLAAPRPTRYQLVPVERPTRKQEQLFYGWLGRRLADVIPG